MKGYQEWLIDDAGNKRTNVNIEVRVANSTAGAGAKATIFANAAGAAKANPFTNLADGSYSFFANDGRYDVVLNPGTVDQKIIAAVEVVDGLDLSQRAVRVASGETAVSVPVLSERTGDEDTVWAFDKDTGAAKALPVGSFPPGPQGPPGTNNTVATLEDLAALDTDLVSAIAAGATFTWKTGDYSALVDGVDYVQSDDLPSTTGAWVRIGQEDLRKLGAFSGATIPDNQTPKQAMQALETAVETKATAAAVGISSSASNLGAFTSPLIDDNTTVKAAIESIGTNLAASGGSGNVGFIQSGTGAVAQTLLGKARNRFDASDFLPAGFVTDGSVDYTTQIQAAIDHISPNGGILYFPPGTFKGNWVMKRGVIFQGAGQRETRFIPATNQHVFRTPTDVSTVRIGWVDLEIYGDLAHTGKNGIHLEVSGTGRFIDTVYIKNVGIFNNGSAGIYATGTSFDGPFVQRMFIDNVESTYNQLYNLRCTGVVIECEARNSSLTHVVEDDGTGKPVSFERIGGLNTAQFTFTNCLFANVTALTATNFAPAIWIDGVSNLNFFGCNAEGFSPAIYLADTAQAEGFTWIGGKFAVATNLVTSIIDVENCRKLIMKGARIDIGTGNTVTNIIRLGGNMAKHQGIDVDDTNYVAGSYTNWINEGASFYQQLAGTSVVYYRPNMTLWPTGGATDLVNIVDENASTTAFRYGDTLTISLFSGTGPITVKNTGNIQLAYGNDFALDDANKTLTLMWNRPLAKWTEVSRQPPVPTGAAVADATGAGDVVAQLNTLLARLRAQKIIAT